MDQYIIIYFFTNVQNRFKKETCIASFKRVNMHPNHCVKFDEWMKIIDNRGFLIAEQLFTKINFLYDAMSDFWEYLSVEHNHRVLSTIKGFYVSIFYNDKLWMNENVVRLAKYFKLDDVFKLRASYFAEKYRRVRDYQAI